MKNKAIVVIVFLLVWNTSLLSQNLPSLLYQKNINSTFSIIAYDEVAKEWGVAVATDNISVGSSTIYIEPNIGAFSVIAETEPKYGIKGIELLSKGEIIKKAILTTKDNDEESSFRQVAGIDSSGKGFAFTGESLKYWNGFSGQIVKTNYIVIGNQLAENVLEEMSFAFENSKGTLAEKLMTALIAGQNVGGQVSGKQSAAIKIKGSANEWFNQIDLRVDNSKTPINDLKQLLNYHYGRIKLNQALYAINVGNKTLGLERLMKAERMLNGWFGMYGKLAYAYSLINDENKAASLIIDALREKKEWKVNLASFYYLRNHPEMKDLIKEDDFDSQDWQNAIMMLTNLNRHQEAINLAHRVLKKSYKYSYSHYLLGKAYDEIGKPDKANEYFKTALALDENNIEAKTSIK